MYALNLLNFVHRLVAIMFIDGRSDINNIVNHIDENKKNNYYKNLEWTTLKNNNKHSFAKKTCQIDPKTNEIIKIYDSAGDACIDLKYERKMKYKIASCCRGERNLVFGYKWKYVEN